MANTLTKPCRIRLQEYGDPVQCSRASINWPALNEANARWRIKLGLPSNPIRVDEVGRETVLIRAERITGVIRIGDIDIEIAPKFLDASEDSWQAVLWQILTIVEGGTVDESFTSAHKLPSLSMPDLLAEVFLSAYARGAANGLPAGYRAESATGGTLRGSLDLSRIGEWLARPWRLPYITDHLTNDTSLARLLRWTAEILARTVNYAGRAQALREIAGSLNHVMRRPPHFLDAQRIKLSAQHRGLEPAWIVGLLLLEGAGLHHEQGAFLLSGFLWNSDKIYENYIFWLCNQAASCINLKVNKRIIRFGEILHGDGRSLETTPDVVFRNADGTAIAVTDSKYKILVTRPKAIDTYQIITAAHVLGCKRVSLTYPVAFNRSSTVWRVSSALGGNDIELTALPINLMALVTRNGLEQLITTISDWLKNRASND